MRSNFVRLTTSTVTLLSLFGLICGQVNNSRISATTTRVPSIETLRRGVSFRSGGSDLVVVFSKSPDAELKQNNTIKRQNVKLVIFYDVDDSNKSFAQDDDFEGAGGNNYTTIDYQDKLDDSDQQLAPEDAVTMPPPVNGVALATIESPCRFNLDREYLCQIPSISRLFPNFTADNWEYDGTAIVVEAMQFGGCSSNASNGNTNSDRKLCFGIIVDGQLASFRPARRFRPPITTQGSNRIKGKNDETNQRGFFAIKYYPDPALTSVTLMDPNNLISVSGYGFDIMDRRQQHSLLQFELIAEVPSKNLSIPIHCNTTYRNPNENGFTCLFEPKELASCVIKKDPIEMTVRFGNWSETRKLLLEKPERYGPGSGNHRPPPPDDVPGLSGEGRIGFNDRPPYPVRGPGFGPPGPGGRRSDQEPPHFTPNGPPPWALDKPPRQGRGNHWISDENDTYPAPPNGTNGRLRQGRLEEGRFYTDRLNSTTVESSPAGVASEIIKIVVPICAMMLVILTSIALLFFLRQTPLRRTRFFKFIFPPQLQSKLAHEMQKFSLDLLPPEMVSTLSKHQIDKSRLLIGGNDLGEGFFGIVRSAILYPPRSKKVPISATVSNPERTSLQTSGEGTLPQKVAVKTIQRYENLERTKEFFEEAIVMFTFNHPNVLSAIGFVSDLDAYPAIVLPLMDGGNLHEFVRTNNDFNDTMLHDFAWQIAKGMAYLASLKLVHRDLAARNCLLNKQLVVKVSDFGLTRQSKNVNYEYGTPQYEMLSQHRPLPIRWLAPECLENGVFTEKSDVWSYGVLLWELAAKGERPYGDMDSSQVVTFVRLENGRLSRTPTISRELYELMSKCWKEHSSERPTFDELVDVTKTLLDDEAQGDYCDPHSHHIVQNFNKQPLEKTVSLHSQASSSICSIRPFPLSLNTIEMSQLTDSTYIEVTSCSVDQQSNHDSLSSSSSTSD